MNKPESDQSDQWERLTGAELVEHIRDGFRLLSSTMFPSPPPEFFGESQHRDMIRLFLVGAMVSRPSDPALDQLVEAVSRPGWRPTGDGWRWGTEAEELARSEARVRKARGGR